MDQTFFIHLFKEYGYMLLFVWSIFEGEIGLMISGILCSKGVVFDYQNVIVIAAFGALIGDNTLFFLGRIYDAKNSEFYKKYKNSIEKMASVFKKQGAIVIIFERFIYGTHIPLLLAISISRYPYFKFLFYDIIGVILWAIGFVSLGYFFGQNAITLVMLMQKYIIILIFIIIIIIFYILQTKGKRKK